MSTTNKKTKDGGNPILPSDGNNFQLGNVTADKISAGVSGAASIFKGAEDLAETNDGFDDEIARIKNQTFSPSGTYSLMEQYNNMFLGTPKGYEDFGGKTSWQYAKGILGTTATGAMAGTQIMPGIGTFIGGLVGLGAGAIGVIGNQVGEKQNEKAYYHDLADAVDLARGNWNAARNAFASNQFDNALKGFYRLSAYGGELDTHGSDFSNGVKYINAGGSHESNPYGGVQMGVDQEGTPNLVEEGEVIVNDYVFSDRMKPSKKALIDAFLDDSLYGESYAKIAEKLARPSEEMANDNIEKKTASVNLSRLMKIQEDARERKSIQDGNMFTGGGPLNKQEYEKRVAAINKNFADNPEQRDRLLADALERFKQSPEYENDRLSRLVTALRKNGIYVEYGRPNKVAKETYQTAMKSGIYSKEQKDALYKAYSEIFGEEQARKDTTPAYKPNGFQQYKTNSNNSNYSQDALDLEAELENSNPIPDKKQDSNAPRISESDPNFTGPQRPKNFRASSSSGSGNRASGSSGATIPTKGNTVAEGEAFEQQQYYQDFLKYMADNPDFRQGWIDSINAGNFGPMGKYRVKDYDDWLRLATDKKIGPVHNATLLAAQNWANTELARREIEYGDINEPIINEDTPQVEGPLMSLMGPPSDPYKYKETLAGENEEPDEPDDDNDAEPKDYSYLLRYAPVLGNALALLGNRKDYSDVRRFESMTSRPRTVRFSPIGTYIRPNLIAPSELSTPIINQMNAERNYIRNNSIGNSTAANNYALASDYLGNAKIGAAYLQGKQYNAEQRQKAAAYNLGIDQYNSEGAFKEQQTNMSLNDYYLRRSLESYNMRNNIDMAYNQAKSSNLTALFNNLGNIGLDTFNRNRANAASPAYNYEGRDGFIRYMLGYYDSLYGKNNNNGE